MSATDPASPVRISYYSDVLCEWAYVSQIKRDALEHKFGDRVAVRPRFCSVYADVETKVVDGWKDRGGIAGYRAHLQEIVDGFDHVTLHPDAWRTTIPTTSSTVHAFVMAVGLDAEQAAVADSLTWQLRLAFFRDGRDVSKLDVRLEVAKELGLDLAAIRAGLDDGRAWAALQRGHDKAKTDHVHGSPTFLLGEGRQMLYGNVGYAIIEANVAVLLRDPGAPA